jgi:integrase
VSRKRGNGEGSIHRRKDGGWCAQYTVYTSEGRKRKTIYGKTRVEVGGKLAKALSDREGGLVFDDEGLTVGTYLGKWLESSLRGAVRQSTFDRYEIAVRVHIKPVLGRLKLAKLAPSHLAGFYQDKLAAGSAPASVNKLHVALHKALDQAVKWHMIPRNVAEVVKAPRPSPEEIQPLNREQAKTLLEVARKEDRFEALYMLAVTTGLRQGELLGLKWEDVDLEDGGIRVRRTLTRHKGRLVLGEPKTKRSRRTVQLTEAAVEALEGHLACQMMHRDRIEDLYEYQGLVFATQKGTLVNPTNLRKRSFEPLLEKAGLPAIRFHDLRHTCATLLLSSNVNPKIVSEMLGHATIAITLDTYSHVLPNMQKGAARALEETLR